MKSSPTISTVALAVYFMESGSHPELERILPIMDIELKKHHPIAFKVLWSNGHDIRL